MTFKNVMLTQHICRRHEIQPIIHELKCDANILSILVRHVLKI